MENKKKIKLDKASNKERAAAMVMTRTVTIAYPPVHERCCLCHDFCAPAIGHQLRLTSAGAWSDKFFYLCDACVTAIDFRADPEGLRPGRKAPERYEEDEDDDDEDEEYEDEEYEDDEDEDYDEEEVDEGIADLIDRIVEVEIKQDAQDEVSEKLRNDVAALQVTVAALGNGSHLAKPARTKREKWVSISVFSKQNSVHPCTVRRAAKRGDLETRRVGRRILVRMPSSDVTAPDDAKKVLLTAGEEWVDVPRASEIRGVHSSILYRAILRGDLESRLDDGRKLVSVSSLNKLLIKRRTR